MVTITTQRELNKHINSVVIPEVLQFLANEIAKIMCDFLVKDGVSLSVAEIVDIQFSKDKLKCNIFANSQITPSTTGEPSVGGFRKFISLDGSETYKNKTIAWWVADWLEEGVSGDGFYIGNQPIEPNDWFTKTVEYLNKNFKSMARNALRQLGLKVKTI